MSAIPYLLMWIFSNVCGFLSDYLISRNYVSLLTARRLFQGVGNYGPMLGMIWLCFVECDTTQAILALCLGTGLNGGVYSGFQVNHVDLSPNYSGTLMGITNTLANICGFVSPYVTGAITKDNVRGAICTCLSFSKRYCSSLVSL